MTLKKKQDALGEAHLIPKPSMSSKENRGLNVGRVGDISELNPLDCMTLYEDPGISVYSESEDFDASRTNFRYSKNAAPEPAKNDSIISVEYCGPIKASALMLENGHDEPVREIVDPKPVIQPDRENAKILPMDQDMSFDDDGISGEVHNADNEEFIPEIITEPRNEDLDSVLRLFDNTNSWSRQVMQIRWNRMLLG